MKPSLRILLCLPLLLLPCAAAHAQYAKLVDPFLGASGGGNVFPGPVVPFGEIKPGPDMAAPVGHDPNAGWNATDDIRGFSQTHVSGTGGGAKYGNILVMPTTGALAPLDASSPRADEHASAGLYSATLARYHIGVDITAARRSAIYRLQYPKGAPANLLIDVSHYLISGAKQGEDQLFTRSTVRILSPTEIAGSTSVTGGWNKQPNSYTVYFYARLTRRPHPGVHGSMINSRPAANLRVLKPAPAPARGSPSPTPMTIRCS